MSLIRPVLNGWLRRVEKRRMRTAVGAEPLRRALELQSRLFFHAPRGTSKAWVKLGNVETLQVTPRNSSASKRVIFYIHGGGFTFGSPRTHAALAAQLAQRVGAKAILPRYRLAPEHPFPAAPQDVRAVWDAITAAGTSPQDVIIGGDSAGGALAFGLLSTLCTEGAAMPGGVFGFSPLTDMTFGGASMLENADSDVILPTERAAEMAEVFLAGHSAKDPIVSPAHGTFKGAPPAWITVGDTEILLDDAKTLAAALRRDGVPTELKVLHDLPHVWPIFHNILSEGRETLDVLADWITQLPGWPFES